MTVRDPMAASHRLTRWKSWTDGESPDGKRTQVTSRHAAPRVTHPPESVSPPDRESAMTTSPAEQAAMAARPRARRHARRADRTQPAGRLRAARRRRPHSSPRATTAVPAARTPRPTPWPTPVTLAEGATAVVTLEPCNHTGRTPPCAQALVAAGVRRVVFAQDDPNPVAAGGAETLRAAGIEVESGLLRDEARAVNRGLDLRGRARPALRHLEARHLPRRPQRRRRRHLALGQRCGVASRHPPAAGARRHDARRHQHR